MKKILLLIALVVATQLIGAQNEFISGSRTSYQISSETGDLVPINSEAFLSYFIIDNEEGTLEHLTIEGNSLFYTQLQKKDEQNREIYRVVDQTGSPVEEIHYSQKTGELIFLYSKNITPRIESYKLQDPYPVDQQMFLIYRELIQDQSNAIRENENNLEPFQVRSTAYHLLKQEELALKDIKKAIAIANREESENLHELYELKGSILLSMNHTEEALNSFTRSIEQTIDSNYYSYYQRGIIYLKKEDYQKAKEDLLVAIRTIPFDYIEDRHNIQMQLGKIFTFLDSPEKAIHYFSEAISLNPKNYAAYFYRGILYVEKMDLEIPGYAEKVINDFSIFLNNRTPDDYDKIYILNNRGQAFMETGNYEMAIDDFTESINLEPQTYSLAMRGDSRRLKGNYEEAVEDFTLALEIDPEFYWAYYRRGWTKEFMKEYEVALNDYTQAIEKNPGYAYSYLARGELLKNHFNPEKAIPDFKKVVELETTPLPSGNAKPFALLHLERENEAISWMLKAVDIHPTSSNFYDLACLYSRTMQTDKAMEALNTAINKGYTGFTHMQNDPGLKNLKEDARFVELVDRVCP